MPKQFISIFLVIVFASLTGTLSANDRALIQKQFVEYYSSTPINDEVVGNYVSEMNADGTWSTINYESKRRGSWETLKHLKQLLSMATAYVQPKSKYYNDPMLAERIVKGLNHWIENDYTNPNWWHMKIGICENILKTFILLGDKLPEETLKKAQEVVLKRSKMGMTGQNKVWLAGVAFMKGYLAADQDLMQTSTDSIWSELVVSTKEGIQTDWSFHQHGPQQQFGNYGRSFSENMVLWVSVTRGTIYATSDEKLSMLRNYLTKGQAWVLWKDQMDLNACGRQFSEECAGYPANNNTEIRFQISKMIEADPAYKKTYKLGLAEPNKLIGHTSFWRSEMAVHRKKNWYASVKMSSTRVIGSEVANNENVLGIHQGDGTLLVYRNGSEYKDIAPLWDWHRLPGTTCDQGMKSLRPLGWNNGYGNSDFSGVLGNSHVGLATMEYKQKEFSAHKAWFFTHSGIVCLGAGIEGKTEGNVLTSVQQSHLQGTVKSSNGILKKGSHLLKADTWLHHSDIGYQLMNNTQCDIRTVEGNWLSCYPSFSDRPVKGDIFSLWIDHGKTPQNQSYAYKIFPAVSAKSMDKLIAKNKICIIINTCDLQALQEGDAIYAVFYKSGELKINKEMAIKVDVPCLLILTKNELLVSDPLQKSKSLTVNINSKNYAIAFPSGQYTGNQVSVLLNK